MTHQDTHATRTGRAAASAPMFIGRDRELASIVEALAAPPALVLIEGEAGIGKTRLLREALASPGVRPSRALMAACPPFRESLTLGPIVDAIRQAVPTVDRLQLSALAGALRPLFPEWTASLPPTPEPLDDAKAARHRLLSAVAELVERLEIEVLVVEDAHWADDATVEFLLLLTSRQQPPNLVVTYRPEDVPAGSLLWRLSSHPPAAATYTRLTLQPLDLSTTASLVSSMLDGEPLSEEFAAFLYERTAGVPLMVEESVRLLRDRADLVRRDGEWLRHDLEVLQVPPTVRDSTLERVRRLVPAAQRVLDAAAVLAEPADEAVVTSVAGLSPSAVAAGVQLAVASGLVEEDDRRRLRFRHQLPATAVYEAIPGPQRRRLHLRAGQALEGADPPPVAQLSRHFREAGETARWAEYTELAADMAAASNDHTTAVRVLNGLLTAADLPTSHAARLARRLAGAALLRRETVGDDLHRHVIVTLRALLDRGGFSATEQAKIRSRLGRLSGQLGDWEAGYVELERAVAHLDDDPVEAARTMTYLGWPFASHWPASTHLQWLQRAAEFEARVESRPDRLALAADRACALLQLGAEEGWTAASALPIAASSREERRELARGNYNIATNALLWGRYAEARQRSAVGMELAEKVGYRAVIYGLQVLSILLDWRTGEWDGLGERLSSLLETDDIEQSAHSSALLAAGLLRMAHGDLSEAEGFFGRSSAGSLSLDDALQASAAVGRLRLVQARVDDAVQVTEELIHTLLTKGVWVWATEIAPVRVEALTTSGRVEDASQLVTRFARGLRGRNAPAPRAALALCRALLCAGGGDHERAAAAFARAARAWERLPRPYDALLARERHAHNLVNAGKQDSGLAVLTDVYERLHDLGAREDADRIAQQLRSHGAGVPRLWRGGRKGYGTELSPRELEVVRLVAAGKTNREVAELLSKSRRTVEVQLRSAMRKLDVSSRTALAVAAVEAGLVAGRRPQDGDHESSGR